MLCDPDLKEVIEFSSFCLSGNNQLKVMLVIHSSKSEHSSLFAFCYFLACRLLQCGDAQH